MPSRILIIGSSLFLLIVVLFFCWHFFLSIYEVKFKHNFTDHQLLVDNTYQIKCVGLNSIGWEINYRNLACEFIISSGGDLIKIIDSPEENTFTFSTLSPGEVIIIINSKYSLNPTRYKLKTIEKRIGHEN